MKRLLTEAEVSEQYGLGLRLLRRFRMLNRGPRFRKVSGRIGASGGRVLYAVSDIEAWLASCPSGGERLEEDK